MPSIDVVSAGAAGALSAGAAGVLAQIVQAVRHRGRDRSEDDAVIVKTASELVTMLRTELREQENRHRTEMARLRDELADAQAVAAAAQAEVTELKRALAAAGGAPAT